MPLRKKPTRSYDAETFRRAAAQRLSVAQFLVDNTSFHLDAMYLAGYSVECALKALILARTPASGRQSKVNELTEVGSKGHNSEYLKEQLDRASFPRHPSRSRPSAMPREVKEDLRLMGEWTTDWRYETGLRREREARSFLAAVTRIYAWVERSM